MVWSDIKTEASLSLPLGKAAMDKFSSRDLECFFSTTLNRGPSLPFFGESFNAFSCSAIRATGDRVLNEVSVFNRRNGVSVVLSEFVEDVVDASVSLTTHLRSTRSPSKGGRRVPGS